MPSLVLRPIAGGFFQKFIQLVGAPTTWEAVDDVVSDGDASYVRLNRFSPTDGQISFVLCGRSNLVITKLDLAVTARRIPAGAQSLLVGWCNHGGGFGGLTTFALGQTYSTINISHSVHPISGAAFKAGDLNTLHPYVQRQSFQIGDTRTTRIEATVAYAEPRMVEHRSDLTVSGTS